MPIFLIPLILQFILKLPELIQLAEQAFSGKPGNGEAKKQLVLNSATAVLQAEQTISGKTIAPDHVDAIMSSVNALTDATVKIFHAVDVFEHKDPTPTAPPPVLPLPITVRPLGLAA